MGAGFIKRAFSSLLDLTIAFFVVYLTFTFVGRSILQNQVPNFDEIYTSYQEIVDAYNLDKEAASEEYNAQLIIAGGDDSLEAIALTAYQNKVILLDQINIIDIEPYNRPLTNFFLNSIFYYAIGFLVVMSIYTVATKGKTLGRKIMKIELSGNVNPVSIFLHDIMLKYFIIVFVFVISMYAGVILFLLSLAIDLFMMSFSKQKGSLRDVLLKMNLVRTGYLN